MGFPIYKIWQILKRFAGTFRQAQTLKLGGVLLRIATYVDQTSCQTCDLVSHKTTIILRCYFIFPQKYFIHHDTLLGIRTQIRYIDCICPHQLGNKFTKEITLFLWRNDKKFSILLYQPKNGLKGS